MYPFPYHFWNLEFGKMAIYIWDRNVKNEHDVMLKKTWN